MYRAGLAWLHGRLRDHFDQSEAMALIERRAPKRGGYLDTTPTWEEVAVLPCLFRPLKAEARQLQGRDAAKTWVRIYFRENPNINRSHRITVDGRHYSPAPSLDASSGGTIWHVDATLIE